MQTMSERQHPVTKLYLYKRGPKPTWYLGGYTTGKKQRSTGLSGMEAKGTARKLLALEQKAMDAAGSGPVGPVTVTTFAADWLRRKREGGKQFASYESQINTHIVPVIGRVELSKVGPDHVLLVLSKMADKAPRTQRNVYRRCKQIFKRAVALGLLATNPCLSIEESEQKDRLPKNEDRNPEWRPMAVFTREEVEALMFDSRIPEDRQMLYGLFYMLGVREGEVLALTIADWTRRALPLGKMLITKSYNTERKCVTGLKTGGSRTVPVHGLLKELLTAWLAPGGGRERLEALAPGKGADLMVPSREGGCRNRHTVLAAFQRDLETLELRKRRAHDTRRTFISLIMDSGGHKDLLKFVTHGRPKSGDAFDQYKEPAWGPLCGEVLKLAISRPAPVADVLPMRKYATSLGGHLQVTYSQENSQSDSDVTPGSASLPCTAEYSGHDGTSPDNAGHLNNVTGLAARRFRHSPPPSPESGPPVSDPLQAPVAPCPRQVVVALHGALEAAERGDAVGAAALLRDVIAALR